MKTFDHGELTVAYRVEGAGTPIVMLHNGGTSSVIWREQMSALAESHRVAALDLPGFGDSPRPANPANLAELVELVHAFIAHLDLAPAVVVGNCMGTNIGASLARVHPEDVTALLAINPLTEASFSGGRIGLLHKMERMASGPTKFLRGLSRRIKAPKAIGTASLRFQLGKKGTEAGLHNDPELLACQLRADQMPALVDVLDDMAAYGDLDRVGVPAGIPVWIVWGEQNRVLSRHRAGDLGTKMNAERTEVIDGTGHLPMLEEPEVITGLIRDLVARAAQEGADVTTTVATAGSAAGGDS